MEKTEDYDIDDDLDDEGDYARLFDRYQEKFNRAYTVSQKIFEMEKAQRETLSFYQRRNNALLDILTQVEGESETDPVDSERIQNVISMNPRLDKYLSPLLGDFKVSKSHKLNLLVSEAVADLSEDDLIGHEINPQDADSWSRRHYQNLVVSKFKPIDFTSLGTTTDTKKR